MPPTVTAATPPGAATGAPTPRRRAYAVLVNEPQTQPGARVVLFTRTGCHLCDAAREVVVSVCESAGEQWREVDIDGDAGLADRYGEYVPVVEVDGVQQGFWQVDPDRLARRLAAPGPARRPRP
jgi:threonine dehydrogenase-like Zn-dependent dehydrogenase